MPQPGDRLLDRVVEGREHLVGEELAVALQQLVVERGLGGALGDRRLPGERLQLALEVLELHDHEPVHDVDVRVERLGRAVEARTTRDRRPTRGPRSAPRGRGSRRSRTARGTGARRRGSRRAGRRAARRRTTPSNSSKGRIPSVSGASTVAISYLLARARPRNAQARRVSDRACSQWFCDTHLPNALARCRCRTSRRRPRRRGSRARPCRTRRRSCSPRAPAAAARAPGSGACTPLIVDASRDARRP